MPQNQKFNLSDLIGTQEAAEALGVSPRRVRVLLKDDCPACEGAGSFAVSQAVPYWENDSLMRERVQAGDSCPACYGTGRRLASVKIGREHVIPRPALTRIRDRRTTAGEECQECHGRGRVRLIFNLDNEESDSVVDCPACEGKGRI